VIFFTFPLLDLRMERHECREKVCKVYQANMKMKQECHLGCLEGGAICPQPDNVKVEIALSEMEILHPEKRLVDNADHSDTSHTGSRG
jgi:hypothetical protein